jgi:hypothetical protein
MSKPDIVILVQFIAEHMPKGWASAPAPRDGYMQHGHWLVGPDDAKLFVRVQTWGAHKGKLEISGCYPDASDVKWSGPSPNPSIGVDGKRPTEAIAKEIARRLLPEYLPLLQRYRETVASIRQRDLYRDVLLAELIGDLNAEPSHREGSVEVKFDGAWDYSHVDFKVASGSDDKTEVTVTFDRMTEAQALRLSRWIRSELEGAAKRR